MKAYTVKHLGVRTGKLEAVKTHLGKENLEIRTDLTEVNIFYNLPFSNPNGDQKGQFFSLCTIAKQSNFSSIQMSKFTSIIKKRVC